jgi:histidinol-phosphate/aromatic aminotransferase/cobyric acid decarboxylase-like protein
LIDPQDAGVLPHVRGASNVIVLRTFSKYFGLAGLRIGYAIGPSPLLQLAERGRPPFNVSHAAEAAALSVLDDGDFLADCRATFQTESALFCERLASLPQYRLRGRKANMLLLELLCHSAAEVVDALAAKGLVVADAACFGGLGNREAIRISLRERAANERLLGALEALR